jgi:uncharacterized protein YndB with AHSA1/START domain
MDTTEKTSITVSTTINAPIDKVWECWTNPKHITQWNHAIDEWHTPKAENDLRQEGKFVYRMEAKDGSMGFDFGGVYQHVAPNNRIEYVMDDGRKVNIDFREQDGKTEVVETFEAETMNSIELQQQGWQSILNNFKKYTEDVNV